MTDETKPKRVRGQKEREKFFRAGFLAGLEHALEEGRQLRDVESRREAAMQVGHARFSGDAEAAPKRTRKRRGEGNDALAAGQSAGPVP